MKAGIRYILLFIYFSIALSSHAQDKSSDVCTVRDGRIYFRLDRSWTNKRKKEVSELFSLDSSIIARAINGETKFISAGIDWETKKLSINIIELSKALDIQPSKLFNKDVLMLDENLFNIPVFYPAEKANYGINNFTPDNIFHYSDGEALFYLPGNIKAKQVILSGSFNNWGTSQIHMIRTSTGWFVKLKLAPGKYQYKYILDGRWIPDPFNKLKQDDKNGGYNSVVFCYNYSFRLQGYTSSHEVSVAGSFNNWNISELKMQIHDGGWVLPIYLRPGTHAYKFIADGKWMTDPGNKIIRSDDKGNMNSVLGIGDTLIFKLKGFLTAKKVILAGEFNAWNKGELSMDKTPYGWELPYALSAGNYQYKFIANGKWINDPSNLYTVGRNKEQNSWLAFKANHTFLLSKFPDAREVIVTGSFNGWNKENYEMKKKNGIWTFPIFLNPGKYTYKFIVDKKWIIDPGNELWEENEVGTGNSVLWIEP